MTEPDRVPPSVAVVTAVAEREELAGTDIDRSLAEVVDPDALDALFRARREGARRDAGRVEFRFCGYDVTVHADGRVEVHGTPGQGASGSR